MSERYCGWCGDEVTTPRGHAECVPPLVELVRAQHHDDEAEVLMLPTGS